MNQVLDPALLRSIHRILQQQTDLNSRIARGPGRINIAKQAEAAFQTELDQAKQLLKDTRMNADRKQLQLQEREARIEDLKSKRNACDSNREFQLLSDQIAADEQANSVQSDEIFELLEKMDEVAEQVQQAEENLVKGQAETEKVKEKVNAELATLNNDLQAVEQELAKGESLLPPDVLREYKRLVTSLGEDALAPVQENNCCHCYTNVTTQIMTELMMKRVVYCKSCGCLLYLAENAAV